MAPKCQLSGVMAMTKYIPSAPRSHAAPSHPVTSQVWEPTTSAAGAGWVVAFGPPGSVLIRAMAGCVAALPTSPQYRRGCTFTTLKPVNRRPMTAATVSQCQRRTGTVCR